VACVARRDPCRTERLEESWLVEINRRGSKPNCFEGARLQPSGAVPFEGCLNPASAAEGFFLTGKRSRGGKAHFGEWFDGTAPLRSSRAPSKPFPVD
jgi:hypothetical protein